MACDFNEIVDRSSTAATKWVQVRENNQSLNVPEGFYAVDGGVLPMWVADMDFKAPEVVTEALVERARHGVFGYTCQQDGFFESIISWMQRRNAWEIKKEWIYTTPGVVPAIDNMIQAFSDPGDKILIQTPVYTPFFNVIKNNHRETLCNPLRFKNQTYTMDFEDLAIKVKDPKAKLAILCHPHNPVGRVWTADELTRFGEICLENDVLVISDEIHSDIILPGNKFVPFGAISPDFAKYSITCIAPSKTFNLAGLKASAIIVPDEEIRARFSDVLAANGYGAINLFGMLALETAYRHGEDWLSELLDYIAGNVHYLIDYISANIPKIGVIRPEGTYLMWLDCRRLGIDPSDLHNFFIEKARVHPEDGAIYGVEGAGFVRMNLACPRRIVELALERISDAVSQLDS